MDVHSQQPEPDMKIDFIIVLGTMLAIFAGLTIALVLKELPL